MTDQKLVTRFMYPPSLFVLCEEAGINAMQGEKFTDQDWADYLGIDLGELPYYMLDDEELEMFLTMYPDWEDNPFGDDEDEAEVFPDLAPVVPISAAKAKTKAKSEYDEPSIFANTFTTPKVPHYLVTIH
jgi:hypothetical protein